jgi:hypothetical protein
LETPCRASLLQQNHGENNKSLALLQASEKHGVVVLHNLVVGISKASIWAGGQFMLGFVFETKPWDRSLP